MFSPGILTRAAGFATGGEVCLGAIGNFRQKRTACDGPCLRDGTSLRWMVVLSVAVALMAAVLGAFPRGSTGGSDAMDGAA